MPAIKDLTGKRFELLTVVRVGEKTVKCRKLKWICICDCGNTTIVFGNNLTKGHTKSCGCLGNGKTSEDVRKRVSALFAWKTMIKNRTKPSSENHPHNGGISYSICDRWLNSFENFYTDMGPRPSNKYIIGLKDKNGNYTSDNCHWDKRVKEPVVKNVTTNKQSEWLVYFGKSTTNLSNDGAVNEEV